MRKVYLEGELDHVALTRVPVNPRTEFTQVTEKSMTTMREDALSVVGEEFADEVDELEEKQRTEKSQAQDLVIKSDEDLLEEDSPYTEEQDIILRAMLREAGVDKAELVEKAWDYAYKKSLPDSAYAWVSHGAGCEKQDGKTPQKCRHLPYKDKSGKADCAHVRAALQAIGGARQGKPMTGVPSAAKQKLRSALKGCQRSTSKAEILETELSEFEEGCVEGFDRAVDMLLLDNEVKTTMPDETKETKSAIDVDAVFEAMKSKEEPVAEKAAVEPDEIDTHVNLLRQIISAEGHGRAEKLEVAQGVLRSMANHVAKEINEITPASPEDVASSVKSQMEDALRPLMDKIAVLEEAVMDKAGVPKSKALDFTPQSPETPESFAISPEASFMAAQGTSPKEVSSLTKIINRSVGLPDDFKRQPL